MMKFKGCVYAKVICTLVFMNILRVNCSSRQDVQALHKHLLNDYDNGIGPNYNQTEPIQLSVVFNLFTIQEFDEKAGKFVFVGFFVISWKDDRMTWDPLEYGNITKVRLIQSMVWTPFLLFAKPYEDLLKLGHDYINVQYNSDGTAIWEVPDIFKTSCTANVAYYPFDRHSCEMFLIPWGYLPDEFEITLPSANMTEIDYLENGSWKLLSTHMEIPKGNIVVMTIKFQRRPLFIMVNFLMPIAIVCTLNIFIFILPPDPGERSAFGVTVLLALAVFLSIVSDKLPSSSEPHIPRVSLYLLVELAISGLCLVFALFGQKIHARTDETPIPNWIQNIACFAKRKNSTSQKSRDCRSETHTGGSRSSMEVNSYPYFSDNMENNCCDGKVVFPSNYKDLQNHLHTGNSHRLPRVLARHEDSCNPPKICEDFRRSKEEGELPLSWTDVGKCFDKFCIVIFMLLNTCVYINGTVDVAMYQRNDF